MSVPYFQLLMLPVLKALVSGAETPISDVRARSVDTRTSRSSLRSPRPCDITELGDARKSYR